MKIKQQLEDQCSGLEDLLQNAQAHADTAILLAQQALANLQAGRAQARQLRQLINKIRSEQQQ